MKLPIISVIIPTYNSAKTIRRAIDSVVNQQGLNEQFYIDLIIFDDHSTDDTVKAALEIINANSAKLITKRGYNAKVTVNSSNSGGPNRGRNHGITTAKGDFIAFLDHDDEWLPDKIMNQLNEINSGYDFIYSPSIKNLEPEL